MYPIGMREPYHVLRGILKQQWSHLTRNEFLRAAGRFEEASGYAQMRTRETCRRLKLSRGRTEAADAAGASRSALPGSLLAASTK